jgi:hypothetical protein
VDGLSGFLAALDVSRRARKNRRTESICRLGEVVDRVVEPLRASQDQTLRVQEEWAELVPPHVAGHCRVRGIEGGQLHVVVDSPVYAYEIRMCSHDVLRNIRQRCPRLGLRKIKVTLA